MVIVGSQKRMDIVVYLPNGRWWIDASLTNPFTRTARKGKRGIKTREAHKRSKWERHAADAGLIFLPAVFATTGSVGKGAETILNHITSKACESFPYYLSGPEKRVWMAAYRRELVERVATAIAHANAVIIDEACIRSIKPHAAWRPDRGFFRYTRKPLKW